MTKQTSSSWVSIAAVERETGLSKDTLRVWERRYGSPRPSRIGGQRRYEPAEVARLRLIKRLIDGGARPGRLLGKSFDELVALTSAAPAPAVAPHADWLALVRERRPLELERRLAHALLVDGIRQVVLDTLLPLSAQIVDSRAAGDLAIFDERLYEAIVVRQLHGAITHLHAGQEGPRVLLTTLPQETHGLGVAMIEALLAADGASCVSLGTGTPIPEVAAAAEAHRVDVVALPFSLNLRANAAKDALASLRRALSAGVAIWVGGRVAPRPRNLPPGVRAIPDFAALSEVVREWRGARPRQ